MIGRTCLNVGRSVAANQVLHMNGTAGNVCLVLALTSLFAPSTDSGIPRDITTFERSLKVSFLNFPLPLDLELER